MASTDTLRRSDAQPIHLYGDRRPYRLSKGNQCERETVEDRFDDAMAMISLDHAMPTPTEFLRIFKRELKIRKFTKATVKTYCAAIVSLFRWFPSAPHQLTREHVKDYLAYLYDADQSASTMSVHLSAIRDAFDKYCFRDVTLGLATPKRARRRFEVLSREEVLRILQAAPSMRDTLMIGLMYGSGIRVGELTQLQWKNIDLDRNQIFVQRGKGQADRHVQLPQQYRELLHQLGRDQHPDDYLFPSECQRRGGARRHVTQRTVQRVVKRACRMAGIAKDATPHSFRHAFATHSFEDGCDIRRIQKVLGHVKLETTTIYINVAQGRTDFPSPLDRLGVDQPTAATSTPPTPSPTSTLPQTPAAGVIRLHTRRDPATSDRAYRSRRRTQITIELRGKDNRSHFLLGTTAEIPRAGFVSIALPPNERWDDLLRRLPSVMRKRVESPEFFQKLQHGITQRMLQIAGEPPP